MLHNPIHAPGQSYLPLTWNRTHTRSPSPLLPQTASLQDSDFPHDHRSLGDYKFIYNGTPVVGQGLDDIIKWWVQGQVC